MSASVEAPIGSSEFSRDRALDQRERQFKARARRYRAVVAATRVLLVAAVIVGWELLSGPVIDPFWLSSPSQIVGRLQEWTTDGTLARNALATVQAMAVGFTVGSAAGVVIGFTLGRVRFLADVFYPFVIAVNSLPKLALAPLFILWFGIGLEGKVVMTSMVCFFLVFYNTFAGARDTDHELLGVMAVMGANRRDRLFKLILPSAATWVFTGLRLAVPYSLVGAVVSEITASSEGLGHLLKSSANTFDTAGTFAVLLVLVAIALVINLAVTKAEAVNARWK
jgi:NitT/TauT family transport system permease protein